jgi:glyoxylase-like metal-dependent hydrolase (beta-lactamase superfamily II)
MHDLAPGLRALPSRPAHAFNVHLVGRVLVDAATRHAQRRILRALRGVPVSAHAVTHAHADHQGASRAVCDALGIPFWAPAREVDALESGDLSAMAPSNLVTRWQLRHWAGPALTVDRPLEEGDELDAGFVALQTPGHSPGHLSYWREEDRTLLAGDVVFGRHPVTGRPGLHEPPARFTLDPARNRASIRRVAELRPSLVVFGHGPPLRDAADALASFAAALSAEDRDGMTEPASDQRR